MMLPLPRLLLLLLVTGSVLACGNANGPIGATPALPVIPIASDTLPPEQTLPADLEEVSEKMMMPSSAVPAIMPDDPKVVAYLMGKFKPEEHPDFVRLGKPYADKEGMYLRREAFEAFRKMWLAARRDGITLKIVSATRDFYRQKEIWEGKWNRFAAETPDPEARARRILEYSSMPGSSRHHWGTDIDLNDLENSSFEEGGAHEAVYLWLKEHAHEYGFCQPYTPKGTERPYGYNEEKWHWSYLPLSKPLLDRFSALITDARIDGFLGAGMASRVRIVDHYVRGINQECR
jgi:zinc D-Ala-D-Ala carboxypeptidase